MRVAVVTNMHVGDISRIYEAQCDVHPGRNGVTRAHYMITCEVTVYLKVNKANKRLACVRVCA